MIVVVVATPGPVPGESDAHFILAGKGTIATFAATVTAAVCLVGLLIGALVANSDREDVVRRDR